MLSVLSWQPNAALYLTVCPPTRRLVTCEVDARVSLRAKCRPTRFETTKRQRNISRTLNGARSWLGVGGDECVLLSALLHIMVGCKPIWNLKAPVASLMLLTCMTSHLFHFRVTDTEQYPLRPLSPLSFLFPLTQRSSTGGQLVDCLDYRVRWSRFHCCEAPKVLRVNSKTYLRLCEVSF